MGTPTTIWQDFKNLGYNVSISDFFLKAQVSLKTVSSAERPTPTKIILKLHEVITLELCSETAQKIDQPWVNFILKRNKQTQRLEK